MKYDLKDDIALLTLPKEVNPLEAIMFYTWYDIKTISDFLRHGKEIREEAIFSSIIDRLKRIELKFDDELTEEELKKRNKERRKGKMTADKKEKRLERIFKKNINSLKLNPKLEKKLNSYGINTIWELLQETNYIIIYANFDEAEIREIGKALASLNLRLNMFGPHEKNRLEEEMEEIKEEVVVSETCEEVETPKIIPATPKTRQTWERHFEYLAAFSRYFGHTYIPEGFKEEGIGKWIMNTRSQHKNGKLSQEKSQKLDAIKMIWEGLKRGMAYRKDFYASLNIEDIRIENGVLVTYYLDGTKKSTADEEFIKILKSIREGIIPAIAEEPLVTYEPEETIIIEPEKVEEEMTSETKTASELPAYDEAEETSEVFNEESTQRIMEIIETSIIPIRKTEGERTIGISNEEIESHLSEIKAKTKELTTENERKRKLIEELKAARAEYLRQIELSSRLDQEIESLTREINIQNIRGQL